jgi:hypothetical protein
MAFWYWIKSVFGFAGRGPMESRGPVRLNARSEAQLSQALKALAPGERGWISFDDAARLFSPTGEPPSEWDQYGLRALGEFAARAEHGSTPERNQHERRVYLTRKAN